jgi:hypothetical protein
MSETITEAGPKLADVTAELADVRERADFYEAERDRERLAAEHHRTAYVELEAEVAAERERIRSAVTDLTFKVAHPGRGSQALDVVPLGALLGLLGAPGVPS